MALISENLVGYWPLDRMRLTAPQTMLDVSGNSLNGTSFNVPTFGDDHRGNPNRAMSCNGTDDYVDVGDTGQTIKSISFWINPDDITSRSIIDLDGGTHSIELDGSGNVTATGWTSPTIYVDGSSSSALVIQDIWNHIIVTTATGISASDFDIGREANYFDGDIAHVRLYTRELTATEAYELYSYEKPNRYSVAIAGCVGHWFLRSDRASGVSIYDESNQGNTGTSVNTPVYTTGHDGSANGAMVLNGLSDTILIPDFSPSIPPISICMWVKMAFAESERSTGKFKLFHMRVNSGGWQIVDLSYSYAPADTGIIWAEIYKDGVATNFSKVYNWTTDWTHIAMTLNDNDGKIYINGALYHSSNSCQIPTITSDIYLGSHAGAADFLPANTQDARIYNTALTQAQINQIYKEYS